jgi:serine/threonine protein kinase
VSLEPGQSVGDYSIVEAIGQGGMGAVYKVRHAISHRLEAMKVLLPDLRGSGGELEARFLREIQVTASLDHPNIARLHTAFRFQNQLLMVMELVEGENLHRRMRTRGLAIDEALRSGREILAALAYAHRRAVVHRDIKPGNIMISEQGPVKLLDFGIASLKGPEAERDTTQTLLTRGGAVIGSVPYMSPEQVEARPVDARSDLYSLGVALYEMVTGTLPIRGETEFAVMTGHLTQTPVAPVVHQPRVPAHVSAAIMRALEKDPARRFQTAEEFSQALGGVAAAAAAQISPALIETASRELSAVIGPIARVIVRRELKNTTDWPTLRQRLAQEIEGAKERERFLAVVPDK